jgi:hypothetical protein
VPSTSCGFADLFESNHQLESRVQNVFFALMWCRARNLLGIRVQDQLKTT